MKINWTTYINSNVNSKLYNDYYYKSTYGRVISVKLLHLFIYVNLSFIEFLYVILLFFFLIISSSPLKKIQNSPSNMMIKNNPDKTKA